MGGTAAGALNTSGFSNSIGSGMLPHYTHITYSGMVNEQFFQVGEKAKELMELHYGIAVSNCDLADMSKRNFFISLFNKSSKDGEKRSSPLNVILALDISGSMNGHLKYDPSLVHHKKDFKNRLQLAKDAIWMFFQKLSKDDIFGFTVFHNQARTIIPSSFVSQLNSETVKNLIYSDFQSGGTTLRKGLEESIKNLQNIHKHYPNTILQYQNRIVMLTDVCDNSVGNEEVFIREISDSKRINTTIIGVSTDFRSETCEKLIEVKGFNYFCAVQNSDLQTYLVDQFDYTFFPCVSNVEITLESEFIESIKVFGTPDYMTEYPKAGNTFTITKMNSGFPSALEINKQGKLETKGGLMLVKFEPKNEQKLLNGEVAAKIILKYEDLNGNKFKKQYVIKQKAVTEQFFSDQAIRKGTMLFYYTQTMRILLKNMGQGQTALQDWNRQMYTEKLEKLREFCPTDKKEELQKVIKIVKGQNLNIQPQYIDV